jgi:hypothetical protein
VVIGKWRSQQNEHKSDSQQLELAHLPKEPFCDRKAICRVGSPEKRSAPGAPVPHDPQSGSASRQLELTIFARSASEIVERDCKGRAGTIRIILKRVNRHGRSSASLPDGTVLVGSSRQPYLDAARVLIATGYDPDKWLEGWRPESTGFALRARLGIAAGLTVDETRTIFAPWKPFSPSAVSPSIRHSEIPATSTLAAPTLASLRLPPDHEEVERNQSAFTR